MAKKFKKSVITLLTLVFILPVFSTSIALASTSFVGLYDKIYDRADIKKFPLNNGALHNFEKDKSLMQNMQVENFKGKIEYNTIADYVTSGESSMKCVITNNALLSAQVVKFKFDCGASGKNIEQSKAINFDIFNANAFAINIKPVVTSSFASYYFDEVKIAPTTKMTVAIELSKELKDTLSGMAGFSLANLVRLEYRVIIPQGSSGDTIVYMDNLRYATETSPYAPPPAPLPMVREEGEVNNFNAPHTVKYTTPEYEVALAGYDNLNQYAKVSYSEDIKKEGAGALKLNIKGLDLGENDATKYSYPALSLRRNEQIGATNLANYNTLSFWIYYDAKAGSNGKSKNPETIKFVFEHRNNYNPNDPKIVSDLIIPKHKWVNIKINFNDAQFALRDYTTALRFWTYGFKNTEVDRDVYFDNITLSTTQLTTAQLGGNKYTMDIVE